MSSPSRPGEISPVFLLTSIAMFQRVALQKLPGSLCVLCEHPSWQCWHCISPRVACIDVADSAFTAQ